MNGTDCLKENLKYQKRRKKQKIKVVNVGESTDTLGLEESQTL